LGEGKIRWRKVHLLGGIKKDMDYIVERKKKKQIIDQNTYSKNLNKRTKKGWPEK